MAPNKAIQKQRVEQKAPPFAKRQSHGKRCAASDLGNTWSLSFYLAVARSQFPSTKITSECEITNQGIGFLLSLYTHSQFRLTPGGAYRFQCVFERPALAESCFDDRWMSPLTTKMVQLTQWRKRATLWDLAPMDCQMAISGRWIPYSVEDALTCRIAAYVAEPVE
jgi:hypothetical protein